MKMPTMKLFFSMLLITAFGIHTNAQTVYTGNHSMFIYGTVTTEDGTEYTGQIRWDDEEAYWFDMFNGDKPENPNIDYLSKEEKANLNKNEWGNNGFLVMNNGSCDIWGSTHTHSYEIQFGNIKELKVNGRNDVILTMQNGERIDVEDGSNDFDANIFVYNDDFGSIEIDSDELDKVQFMAAPNGFKSAIGTPVYGTVKTNEGDYTGFIQWDKDERVGEDKIDGDTEDGELSIAFEKIRKIEKAGGGSRVELHSGRKFFLDGTNDVDSRNNGIIVNIPDMGRVLVDWGDFIELNLTEVPNSVNEQYENYAQQEKLNGTVTTNNGQSHSGRIVFDLDEEWNYEMLDGDKDDFEYTILMGSVQSISPKNKNYSTVILKNGQEYLLEDSVDVDEKNDGVLVFSDKQSQPTYIAWKDLKTVVFE